MLLEAHNLSVGYPGQKGREGGQPRREILAGIDLALPSSRFVALLGPNGSGKSTLIRSLAGLQPILAGTVTMDGVNISQLDLEDRASRLATVLTERFDSGYFSVADIVAFGRYPHTGFRNELAPKDRDVVRASLEAVGLEGFSRRMFAELSDGERQKALIALALAQETDIIILDEPTAFLDAPARSEIFHLVHDLALAGKSIILSTHEVDLALREADEIWLINRHGRLIAGNPDAVIASGAIGAAFDSPRLAFDAASLRFIRKNGPGSLNSPELPLD
ncbi:MAG: ABC transporter ATP-binding protein [Spirochaetota bacterium]